MIKLIGSPGSASCSSDTIVPGPRPTLALPWAWPGLLGEIVLNGAEETGFDAAAAGDEVYFCANSASDCLSVLVVAFGLRLGATDSILI